MAKPAQNTLLPNPPATPSSYPQRPAIMLKEIEAYEKEELYQKVQQLLTENAYMQQHQQQRLEELIGMIQTPKQRTLATPQFPKETSDPFQHLFAASHGLQQEIAQILSQFRILTASLEQQAAAQTEALRENEANLTSLIENTSDMILSVNKQFEVLVINSAFQAFAKDTYDICIQPGDILSQVLPKHTLNFWQAFFQKALQGESFKTVAQIPQLPGNRYFEFSFNPIRDGQSRIKGVSFFCKEITEYQLAQQEIQEKEQLLTSINYSIKEGIFRSSSEKGIIYVNKAFAEMFGYQSVEEVQKLDPYALYSNPSRRDDFVRMIREKDFFTNEEVLFKRKDGSTFWGLISSIKTVDQQGNIYHDGAIRDVTKLREQERLLKEQIEELTKVNSELDRFVYSTSHDLRAPLVSIAGLINIARHEKSEAVRQTYFDHMEGSINKLDNFIKDIISYSRNSRLELKREKIDFVALVESVWESLQYLKEVDQVEHHLEVSEEAPFYGDSTRLNIIFNNIISNALRYHDPKKAQSYLKIDIKLAADAAEITISDNGIGIEAEYLDRIFEMFFRATQRSQGSGIGLYIVKEAVQKLNGSITVDSTEGEGTTFHMCIPAVLTS